MTGSTSNLWVLYLQVDGIVIPDAWDKKTGGGSSSQDVQYRPGGTPDRQSQGGPKDIENVTLERQFIRERDLAVYRLLEPKVGKGQVVVTQQALDSDYLPFGAPIVYTGRLTKATPPEVESNATSTSMLSIECSISRVS